MKKITRINDDYSKLFKAYNEEKMDGIDIVKLQGIGLVEINFSKLVKNNNYENAYDYNDTILIKDFDIDDNAVTNLGSAKRKLLKNKIETIVEFKYNGLDAICTYDFDKKEFRAFLNLQLLMYYSD